MSALRSWAVIGMCVFLALVLDAFRLPDGLPEWVERGRPAWLCLVVFYWTIALPNRTGIFGAWCAGLAQDVVLDAPLGVNAFAMTIVALVALSGYERFRMYSLPQQAIVVGGVVILVECVRVASSMALSGGSFTPWAWLTALTTLPLWIPAFLAQRALRRGLHLS